MQALNHVIIFEGDYDNNQPNFVLIYDSIFEYISVIYRRWTYQTS